MASNATGPRSGYASPPAELLVLRGSPPRERADAARNRAAVLDAAAALFAAHGVANVSMDAIAGAAGVGKGTLFRRFGDKAGLAVALLDERERALQEGILSGPPPLGPGNRLVRGRSSTEPAGSGQSRGEVLGVAADPPAPAQRLRAFVSAYLDYALAHLDLVRMSETASPGARYRIGAYRFWHRHVALLLAAAGRQDPDALAHVVLAPLSAEHLHAAVSEQDEQRVRAATLTFIDSFMVGDD